MALARRGTSVIISVLRVIGLIIVAFLVVYILLCVFDANQANQFATFVRNGANFFSLGLTDLFQPANPKVAVAVNYGIAAVIWLVITNFVTGLVRRVG